MLISRVMGVLIKFIVCDYLENRNASLGPADLVNFGFETSIDTLSVSPSLFSENSLILAPLSTTPSGSPE